MDFPFKTSSTYCQTLVRKLSPNIKIKNILIEKKLFFHVRSDQNKSFKKSNEHIAKSRIPKPSGNKTTFSFRMKGWKRKVKLK